MRKLFLLEDDLSLISGLTFAFKKQGFALDTARTLAEAEVLWSDRKYDLLVLDVSLPDGSGFDFCQKVRRTSNVPILFLTASDEEMNIIMGLELGGDDYLTKPFKLGVLLSRVNALLRRANASSAGEPVLESGSIPGDTTPAVISALIADEAAIGMVNSKTTAVRVIPAIGRKAGEILDFGGLLGYGPIMPVNQRDPSVFINRGGRLPAPMQSLKN